MTLVVLVTGKSGQIAQSLKYLSSEQIKIECIGRPQLDICDRRSIRNAISAIQPNIVVNTAAFTAVDDAESELDIAFATNCNGAGLVASECARAEIPIIHVSTDYVFDGGKQRAYREIDQTEPGTVYGKSKLCGELKVQAANPKHVIVRTAWVFSAYLNNFLQTMNSLAQEKDTISVVDDQFGSPSFAGDIAAAIITIANVIVDHQLDWPHWGTYHFANLGRASWYDFAIEIMRLRKQMNLRNANILPINSGQYPSQAIRPKSSLLNCEKIKNQFAITPRDWKAALAICIEAKGKGAWK